MAYIPNSGSVVAFQGGTRITSVISSTPSSMLVGASIIGLTPVSISNFPTNQNVSGSVVATQGTNPWVITGSVQASLTPTGNQSVSGTVGASIIGQVPAFIIGGSIATATTNSSVMLLNSAAVIGSVTTLQGTNPWVITGSVQGSFSPSGNQSVSGTVGASIIGTAPVFIVGGSVATATTNSSVMLLNGANVIGSVTTLQGTNPWIITGSVQGSFSPSGNQSVSGTVGASIIGTAPVFIVGGSVATATTNSSVMLLNGANVVGSVATLQGSNPWIITGSIQGAVSVIGQVPVFIIGGSIATATTNSSVVLLNGANVIGSVTALQGTSPWNISGSVTAVIIGGSVATATTNSSVVLLNGANVIGSVATLQGTSPWVVNFQNPSILSVPVGSTIAILQAPSIVGTYAEDAGHTSGDKGVFVLAVRNDTVSSTASADLDYTVHAVDAAGRTITKPFVGEDGTIISYTGSVVSTSVTLIQASAIGKKSYITDFWVTNTGASNTLVTFKDGSASILGYTIAPATGGSNSPGINIPLKTNAAQDLTWQVATASSVVYLTVKGYQAP